MRNTRRSKILAEDTIAPFAIESVSLKLGLQRSEYFDSIAVTTHLFLAITNEAH
jgi:hypothetical protein